MKTKTDNLINFLTNKNKHFNVIFVEIEKIIIKIFFKKFNNIYNL